MTRSPRRSSLRRAARGFRIRAWGQREPARQGTGRLDRSALGLGGLKGGLDIPASGAQCSSLQREHPLRSLTRRAGRIGNASIASHRSLPYEMRRPWFLSPSNQALATAPFPSGLVGRSPEAPVPRSTRKAGLTDGSRPHRTTSGPRRLMSRWPSCTSARCRSGSTALQHNAWAPGQKAL